MPIPVRDKIIGGKFGFPTQLSVVRSHPIFLSGNPSLLFNARSGIKLIIDYLRPTNIWLPSYLCPTIISAIDPAISKIVFYPVNSQLKISSLEFMDRILPDDLFLVIDYFGYPSDRMILEMVHTRGCKIIRDCSQALFFDWQIDSCDFHLYSPRKFLGVPDGGILHIRKGINKDIQTLSSPDEEVIYSLFQALLLRREFDLYGGDRNWYEIFQQAEEKFMPGYSRMSELTIMLLENAFNYEQINKQRRDNYQTLSERLREIALFPFLAENVIPIGFPVRVQCRNEVQEKLFTKSIYPPIHWNIKDAVPQEFSESHQLAQEIMTLPSDHRYNEDDMNYLADSVLEFLK